MMLCEGDTVDTGSVVRDSEDGALGTRVRVIVSLCVAL